MAPNSTLNQLEINNNKNDSQSVNIQSSDSVKRTTDHCELEPRLMRKNIVWKNVIIFTYLHIASVYAIYLLASRKAQLLTFIICYLYGGIGAFGITAGAHRLWAHKCYKAKWQLRLILAAANLIAFQNSIYEWVRDHRVHHKHTDTNADPHNSIRGFFFSHIGWLMLRKHPDIKLKGSKIDMSDLMADPIVMYQKKYYLLLMPIFCFIIPTILPCILIGEKLSYSWYIAGAFRWVLTLHCTWLVNSAAHMWGMRPYDKTIRPSNNIFVAVVAYGEGWHNYHHVFPWDYKTSEFGDYSLNFTTAFIDFFARIGWAYDLKTVSKEVIEKRVARTGSKRTNEILDDNNNVAEKVCSREALTETEPLIWGWDDHDMNREEKSEALILQKLNKTK